MESNETVSLKTALLQKTYTMEQNVYGPETYFVISIVNFVEMVFGIVLGIIASFNAGFWLVGFIGHFCAFLSVTLTSVWIWIFYESGVHT